MYFLIEAIDGHKGGLCIYTFEIKEELEKELSSRTELEVLTDRSRLNEPHSWTREAFMVVCGEILSPLIKKEMKITVKL